MVEMGGGGGMVEMGGGRWHGGDGRGGGMVEMGGERWHGGDGRGRWHGGDGRGGGMVEMGGEVGWWRWEGRWNGCTVYSPSFAGHPRRRSSDLAWAISVVTEFLASMPTS